MTEDLSTGWWNAAGPLEPIKPHVSAIDTVGDADWYYFYTSAPGEVKVGINWVSGDHTSLHLYRWDGGALVACGNANNNYSQRQAVRPVAAGGSLLRGALRLLQQLGRRRTSFTVSGLYTTATCPAGVQAHPAAVSVTEDLSTGWWNAAGPLEPIKPHVSAIDTVGDADWYYFYTSAPGEVKVGINWVSGDHTSLHLYRWDGGALVACGNANNNYSQRQAVRPVAAGGSLLRGALRLLQQLGRRRTTSP